jgi:hypothetical protein
MKVVINKCFGGFSLSPEATLECYRLGMTDIATPVDEYFRGDRDPNDRLGRNTALNEWRQYLAGGSSNRTGKMFLTVFSPDEKFVLSNRPSNRSDAVLVQVVESMGEKADGACADLRVVEIPDGIEYEIDEYDGLESIHETHRSWS